jgi:rfaE bifunctional protein nucleotidyltransferase chain/domain
MTSRPSSVPSAGLILTLAEAAALAADLRGQGQIIVATNGCFDVLHRGHVDYLGRARALGDALFVGLNGDGSVRQLKGIGRPVTPEEDRAAVLAALRPVDVVVIFHELTAERLVAAIRPSVYVKGADWDPSRGDRGDDQKAPPEAAVVQSYGGRVVYLPYLRGRSTTELLEQIMRL